MCENIQSKLCSFLTCNINYSQKIIEELLKENPKERMSAARLLEELKSLLKEEKLQTDQKKELPTTSKTNISKVSTNFNQRSIEKTTGLPTTPKTIVQKKPKKFDVTCIEKKTVLPTTTQPSIEVKGSSSNEQKVTLVLKRVKESETEEKKSRMENVVVEVEQHEIDSYF